MGGGRLAQTQWAVAQRCWRFRAQAGCVGEQCGVAAGQLLQFIQRLWPGKAQGDLPTLVEALVIAAQGLLEGGVEGDNGEGASSVTGIGGDAESDPMYDQACEVVLKHRRASISLVQRHLRIGYNRAARLLEQMEQSGMVSAMQSNGNREILVPAAAAAREEA